MKYYVLSVIGRMHRYLGRKDVFEAFKDFIGS